MLFPWKPSTAEGAFRKEESFRGQVARELKQTPRKPETNPNVISDQTKNAIERQIRPHERFPGIEVLDAIGLEHPVTPELPEDDE